MPGRDASNEYAQHMFSWKNKKNISTFWLKNALSGIMRPQQFYDKQIWHHSLEINEFISII